MSKHFLRMCAAACMHAPVHVRLGPRSASPSGWPPLLSPLLIPALFRQGLLGPLSRRPQLGSPKFC